MAKIDIDKDKFTVLFNASKNVRDFAEKLGYSKHYNNSRLSGTYYKEIKRKCIEYDLNYKLLSKRTSVLEGVYLKLLIQHISSCKSIAELLRRLKLKNHGGNRDKIKKTINNLNLDITHFTGELWSKGNNRFNDKRINNNVIQNETAWEKIFIKGSKTKNATILKRLVLSGKRQYKCNICGLSRWKGKPIRLRLDHIDGDNINNLEENLRIICPNCDSQTDTFCRGQNKKSDTKMWWEHLSR